MAEEHQIELSPVIKADDVVHSAKRLQSVLRDALNANAGRELNSQLINIKGNIEKITTKSEATVEAIKKEQAEFERLGTLSDKQSERVSRANEELKKQEAILNKMVKEQSERSVDSYSYERAQEEIDAQQKLVDIVRARLIEERKERDRVDALQLKSEENLAKLTVQQEQLNNQTRIYGEKWNYAVDQQDKAGEGAEISQQRKEMSNLNKGIMGVTTSVRSLGMLVPGVSTKGFRAVSMLTRSVVKLSSLTKDELLAGVGQLKKAALTALDAIAAHPLVALILAAVAAITFAVKKLVDETKKDVENIIKTIKSGLQLSAKLFKKFVETLTKGFIGLGVLVSKTIMGSIAKIANELYSLKGVISENLKLMAKWRDGNNAVNKALSNLTSSLDYLKAALASAFVPILTVIEPILTRLIDQLAEAITYIGMFIAKLSGATTFQKAIRVQKDYAKALDKTGSAAKKALAPFDELNVLTSKQGGAGGAAADFEEIALADFELPDWLKDLYELGRTVGTKLRDMLNSIPWDSVKAGAENAAQGISDFLNGLLSVRDLGTSIGHSIGELINTFTTFANTLLTKIHFGELGAQLGRALQEAIQTIDWDDVGDIFSNSINALFQALYSLFTEFGGEDLGKAFTEMLQSAVGGINWAVIKGTLVEGVKDITGFLNEVFTEDNFSLLGKTLTEALDSAFLSIKTFAETADWKEWGDALASGIKSMFDNFDPESAGQAISSLASGLLTMVKEAILKIDWNQIADTFIEFISNIDWGALTKDAEAISKKLMNALYTIFEKLKDSEAFDAIIELIVTFLNEKKNWEKLFKKLKREIFWEVLGEKIAQGWERFKEGFLETFTGIFKEVEDLWSGVGDIFAHAFDGDSFLEIGKNIVLGIAGGILAALDSLLAPIRAIFEGIENGICNIFGIHSPATTMEPIGKNIVLGILEGFKLVDFLGKLKEWWATNVTPWFENIKEKIDIAKEALTLKVGAIKDSLINAFRAIKNGLKNPINGIISMVESLVNKIIDGVNWLVTKLNSIPDLEITNPFTGSSYSLGINLPKLTPIEIPRLAQGAVIPPNREFVAMLGDQKSGTNVEAPLDTIKQAVAEVLQQVDFGGSGQPINIYLGTEKIYSEIRKMEKRNILMGG